MNLGLIILSVGLLECTLAIPMILQKVKRNNLFGFRTRKTLSDDKYWYPVNKRSGIGLFISGFICIVAGSFMYEGIIDDKNVFYILSVTTVPALLMSIDSYLYQHRI